MYIYIYSATKQLKDPFQLPLICRQIGGNYGLLSVMGNLREHRCNSYKK